VATNGIKVFGGSGSPRLTRAICRRLDVTPGRGEVLRFPEGNLFVRILENVRGREVYLVQSTAFPANDNFMELLFWVDAFKRASADSVTAVVPYFSYAKGDKKDEPRVSIRARVCADALEAAGADRVVTMDLHAAQIQGFFDVPVDHLFAAPVILDAVREMAIPDLVIVSPDAGGVERARAIAKRLGVGLAIVDKRRTAANVAEVMHVIGEVAGKNTLILDDIIDTAGTLTKTVEALKAQGAQRILAAGVHGVLSGPALERIEKSPIEQVIVTNTTPVEEKIQKCSKVRALSVAPLLGEAIMRIHENSSVSSLFV